MMAAVNVKRYMLPKIYLKENKNTGSSEVVKISAKG